MTEAVDSPMRAGTCTFASGVRVTIILHAGARASRQGGGICPSEGALLMNIPARRADGDSVLLFCRRLAGTLSCQLYCNHHYWWRCHSAIAGVIALLTWEGANRWPGG